MSRTPRVTDRVSRKTLYGLIAGLSVVILLGLAALGWLYVMERQQNVVVQSAQPTTLIMTPETRLVFEPTIEDLAFQPRESEVIVASQDITITVVNATSQSWNGQSPIDTAAMQEYTAFLVKRFTTFTQATGYGFELQPEMPRVVYITDKPFPFQGMLVETVTYNDTAAGIRVTVINMNSETGRSEDIATGALCNAVYGGYEDANVQSICLSLAIFRTHAMAGRPQTCKTDQFWPEAPGVSCDQRLAQYKVPATPFFR